jgi:hypothetical protein
MKIKTEINQKKNVRVHIVFGEFDVNALLDSLSEMYRSLPLQSDMNVLWDLRAADGVGMSTSGDLHKVVDLVSDNWGSDVKNRAALVVSGQVDLGLARDYEQQMEHRSAGEVRIFKDIKKAVRWIDQDALR